MAGHHNFHHQISSWTSVCTWLTLLPDTDTLSVVDSGRYRYLNLLTAGNKSGSTAIRAFVSDNLSGSMTIRTGLYILDGSEHGLLGIYHLAGTMTLGTGFR